MTTTSPITGTTDTKTKTYTKPSIRADVYTRVTDRIVAELEAGVRPWMKPWANSGSDGQVARPVRHNGIAYRGINILMLWSEAMDKGFSSSMWMTYRQAQALGGRVRKGETGSLVVYADSFTKTETDDHGEDVELEIPFLKGYTVFNVEQIDDLPEKYYPRTKLPARVPALIALAEDFFAATGARFRHGGDRAFYSPTYDFIQLPPLASFRDSESYAATKAHELVHWTGNQKRLDRTLGQRFGDAAYAAEELVAEMGAAFLCSDLRVTPETMPDHADYLACWLRILKDDKRAIFTAASQAQKAADYLHDLQLKANQ
ncbi:MAG: ArdC family protein [Lysobacterales bacterium]